ncbi:MAG: N-acetylmuramoyl-L-alanine amidase [Armatimonadetes bacterium]|nr:N-acetylmuramoyl-L-alanine amidase [Armatimonadota bacterium]
MKGTRILLLLIGLTLAAASASAGPVVYLDADGNPAVVDSAAAVDALSAIKALAGGPQRFGLSSAVPRGTAVLDLVTEGVTTVVNFSNRLTSQGLDEARTQAIFEQVKNTLWYYGIEGDVVILVNGVQLADLLPPAPDIVPPFESGKAQAGYGVESLSGHTITLSPGHGIFWNGTGWYTQRPVYCAPLSQEDFHNLDYALYLTAFLEADGMVVKKVRCHDKAYGNYGAYEWWKMASPYWLQHTGYPCTVYGSYSGCTLGDGATEVNDDIRARPLASDYDGTDIYISLHTNGLNGDCYGGTCPSGTITYYDCGSEHKKWCTVSTNLANAVHDTLISTIHNEVGDSSWTNRGKSNSNGAYGEIRIPDRAAILIELAFHDTCENDAVKLRDPFWTSGAMWGIYKGVCTYFGTTPTWGFYSDEYVSDTIPAQLAPGETRQVSITLRNRGVNWNEDKSFRLGAVGDSDPFTAATRHAISGNVAPGQTYTWTFSLTAPTVEGNYVTDWQMVRDGVQWFGAAVTRSIQVGGAGDTEPPTVPANLSAAAVSSTRIDLTWTPSTDNSGVVSGYKVFRNGGYLDTTSSAGYSDTNCASNTTYTYAVSAFDGALNESAQSAPAQATTPAVTDFIIDNPQAAFTGTWLTGTSSVDKYGDNYNYISTSTGETGTAVWRPTVEIAGNYDVFCWYPQGANRTTAAPYIVYWDGGSQQVNVNQQAGGGQWVGLVAAKPFAAGTAGYLKLGNGTGEASLVVMADAARFTKVAGGDTQPPTVPTNLSATAVSGSQVNLAWTASTDNVGVAGYKIFRGGTQIGTSATNSYSDTTCAPNTTYTYTVSAYDAADNESAQSSPAQATTPGDTTPPVISGVSASAGAGNFTASWTTNEPATSQVEYGLTTSYGNLTTLDANLVTSHSMQVTGLARRTTYHYRVRSKDASGNEAISGDYTIKTK